MDHQFTLEELNQFNFFCLREFYMPLETIRTLVSSALTLKARNARNYRRRTFKKKMIKERTSEPLVDSYTSKASSNSSSTVSREELLETVARVRKVIDSKQL